MIRDNVWRLKEQIAVVCQRIGRRADEITLVGVTKFAEAPAIKEAIEAGIVHIGENRVQEGQRKFPQLDQMGVKVTKHLIGHLQTNKAKHAVEFFDVVESVDSLKLALELQKQAEKLNKQLEIFVQVSTSGEEQKFGIEAEQTVTLIDDIAKQKNISIKGLMTIAPLTDNKDVVRQCFKDLRVIRDQIQKNYPESDKVQMKYLSMGMSQDFEIALEEGANMLRIGSAIFK
jgi:pyridoxal phosphate enzyme (YggS family)